MVHISVCGPDSLSRFNPFEAIISLRLYVQAPLL